MRLSKIRLNIFILVLVFFSALFFSCTEDIVNPPPSQIDNEFTELAREFLSNKGINLDLNNDNTFVAIPDSIVINNEIIFTGESHGVKESLDIELNLLKYLNRKYKTRYLLLELGYSTSQLLNNYLETGNKEILNNIFKWLEGTYYWTNEQYKKWIDLYEYNKLLPDDEKIICVGVDVEHQYLSAIDYLETILPDGEPPEEIKYIIDELINNYISNKFQAEIFVDKLKTELEVNRVVLEEYLGESYFDFEIVINGIDKLFNWSDSRDYNTRDGFMYDAFLKLYSKLPNGKYYGHFGNSHILQRPIAGTNWFAGRLNAKDSPVEGRIHSIKLLYKNCKAITTPSYETTIYNTIPNYFKVVIESNIEEITFFSLAGGDSPFQDTSLVKYYENESGFEFPITEYFESIILIQNGNAMTPLN